MVQLLRFRSNRRHGRLVPALLISAALLTGTVACSDDGGSPDGSASASSDSKLAAQALDEGLAAHSEGDLEAASASYEKVLEYDPNNQYAFYNLALIDEANGNYGLAEAKYREAIDADPNYEPALFNLAILRTARGDTDEAITLYQSAVEANKKDAAAWLNLGLLLRETGDEKEGDKAVLHAIGLDSSLVDPQKAVGNNDVASPSPSAS